VILRQTATAALQNCAGNSERIVCFSAHPRRDSLRLKAWSSGIFTRSLGSASVQCAAIDSYNDPYQRRQHSGSPENSPSREQGDGGDDQADFKEAFT